MIRQDGPDHGVPYRKAEVQREKNTPAEDPMNRKSLKRKEKKMKKVAVLLVVAFMLLAAVNAGAESASDDLFGQISGQIFEFSSGAGAWSTELVMGEDGAFTGSFHDSEMGDAGEDYPYGTIYGCSFHGQFSDPEPVDEYSWTVKITVEQDEGQVPEAIEDGIRYVTETPYGLEQAQTVTIFLPGTPVDLLPEDFMMWSHLSELAPDADEIPYFAIWNEEDEAGFVSFTAAGPQEAEAGTGRQDGERFEGVIMLEGMEETVKYEHVRNDTLGFEMDYDYERFERRSESDSECFVSVYDDPDDPENYLEVTYNAGDADTAAAAVKEALSNDYDIIEEPFVLDRAGECVRIDASEAKGGNGTPDLLQMVYIIPAHDGSLIAAAHYSFESADGFGARFRNMMHTFAVIDGRQEGSISDEQALSAVRTYCRINNPDLESIENDGEYTVDWEILSSDENEIVVLFRSYTGAQLRYYIDPVSGETYVTEFVPGITSEEERADETINLWDYVN